MDFCLLLKIWVKILVKILSENLICKYIPGMLAMLKKLLDRAKKSVTDALKITSKRVIQNTGESTDDLVGDEITNRITNVLKKLTTK